MQTRVIAVAVGTMLCLQPIQASDAAKRILEKAIKAHGGKEKLVATLTGKFKAKVTGNFPQVGHLTFIWEETYQLPKRYKRTIKGKFKDMPTTLEYAIVDGKGWIRQNGGKVTDITVQKVTLERVWNATLGRLPKMLGKGYKLSLADKAKVFGREAVGLKISSAEGEGEFLFDKVSGLLVKIKKRMDDPLTKKEVDGEVLYSNFKDISGVKFPMTVTAYSKGKKLLEFKLINVQFLDKIADSLFDKP